MRLKQSVTPASKILAWFIVCVTLAVGSRVAHPSVLAAQEPTPAEITASLKQDWPTLRVRYLELYWKDTDDEEEQVLKAIGDRIAIVAGAAHQLPDWLADDPVALVALASRVVREERDNPAQFEIAEQLARRAIKQGNPSGIGLDTLTWVLIFRVGRPVPSQTLAPETLALLDEAERQLDTIATFAPDAHMKLMRGRIAMLRGRRDEGMALLKAANEGAPNSKAAAWELAMAMIEDPEFRGPFVPEIEPLQARFPNDPHLGVFLAVALFRDRRFAEASRRIAPIRERALETIGPKFVETIEQMGGLSDEFGKGLEAFEEGRLEDAERLFREAAASTPDRVEPASMLARSIWKRASDLPGGMNRLRAMSLEPEVRRLANAFPKDAEIVVSLVAILTYKLEYVEAAALLDQLDRDGVDYSAFLDRKSVDRIRADAARMRQPIGGRRPAWNDLDTIDLHGWDRRALIALGVWGGWIVFMALAGLLLTPLSRPKPGDALPDQVGPTRRESWLNWLYLLLITIALLMFYISVPFVVVGLMCIALALFAVLFAFRLLVIDVLIRGFDASWGVIRSAFAGPVEVEDGILANSLQQPELFRVLDEVAERCEVARPERVLLTPDTMLGVSESRSGLFGLFGRRTRTLRLGLAVLPVINVDELKSILAHEFAHFSHQDTYYGRFLFQVNQSLALSLAHMSAAAGWLNYVNPFYWAFWLYLRSYGLLAAGFMRTREYQADRMAARLYGRTLFSTALTRVVVESPLFERVIPRNIVYELSQGRRFENLYDEYRKMRDSADLKEYQAKVFEREVRQPAGWFDSHPSLSDRIAAISGFPEARDRADATPATHLIAELPELEVALTYFYTRQLALAAFGVVMPEEPELPTGGQPSAEPI